MLAGYPEFYDDNPMGIYKKIVDGYYEIPVLIRPTGRELIKRFLIGYPLQRAGSREGAEEVKSHKWIVGVDWNLVFNRQISPYWTPSLSSEIYTKYFDLNKDPDEEPLTPTSEEENLFKDF